MLRYSYEVSFLPKEADDVDYESESSVQDSIDTDFAESEEAGEGSSAGGSDDDGEKNRRTRRVITKSYKEPKTRKSEKAKSEQTHTEKNNQAKKPDETVSEGRQLRTTAARLITRSPTDRKPLSSETTALRRKALMSEIAQRKNVPEVRRLTQEELLAEAKITEEINKRSLARYQRLEVERKKIRAHRTVSQQPMIKVHHFAVPCVAEQPEVYGAAVNTESGEVEFKQMLVDREAKCSRTLVTFTDQASFIAAFPTAATATIGAKSSNIGRPRKRTRYCPMTGRLARYMDPVTRTPYADLAAFQALRYLYRLHLENGTPAIELLRKYRSGELRMPES